MKALITLKQVNTSVAEKKKKKKKEEEEGMQCSENIILLLVPKAVNGYYATWLANIFFLSFLTCTPYQGLHARTQAPYELIASSFRMLSPSKVESPFLEYCFFSDFHSSETFKNDFVNL